MTTGKRIFFISVTMLAVTVGLSASASQSLATGASAQAASLEETGASLEKMASMTQLVGGSDHRTGDLPLPAEVAKPVARRLGRAASGHRPPAEPHRPAAVPVSSEKEDFSMFNNAA